MDVESVAGMGGIESVVGLESSIVASAVDVGLGKSILVVVDAAVVVVVVVDVVVVVVVVGAAGVCSSRKATPAA